MKKTVVAVADLGAPPPPLFWVKRIAEGRKAGRASDEKPGPPLAQGLDPSLCWL